MNRSILIVICDFLLVSLLAFSTVDINKATDEGPRQPQVDISTNQAESGKDLAAVMRLALNDERKNRDLLMGELARVRDEAARRQALLGEREKEAQSLQQELRSRDELAARLESERTNLQQQVASAQSNMQGLTQQLQAASSDVLTSREKLSSLEAALKKQADEAAALQQHLANLERTNQQVIGERQRLATQLQVAEVEKRHATEQVARMENEVKVQREEKARLTEGVKALASRSGELAQEIRENRPLAANTIFSEFLTNRVQARFSAMRAGVLGDVNRQRETETVLVTDGTNTFALCHLQETPIVLGSSSRWEELTGTLTRNAAQVPIKSLAFGWPDPRALFMPVTPVEAKQLGGKVYRVSAAPYKFQDAVLVGAREGYYGECRFQIDLSTPGYVKLDNSFIKGLFGKFNPSRGDLVFSKTGELIGMMVNTTYCIMIDRFDATGTVRLGRDFQPQRSGQMLAGLNSFIAGLPPKLQ